MRAAVEYTVKIPWYDPRSLFGEYYGLGGRWRSKTNVELKNGRERHVDVDRNGFELARFDAILQGPKTKWLEAGSELFPAVEQLVSDRFGAKALVFDHIIRGVETAKFASKPVPFVHNDYSVDSGKPRVRALLKDFTDPSLLQEVTDARVAIVNVWCPLEPVQRDPLAFVDWRTTDPEDLVVVHIQYTTRSGETSVVYPNPNHEWVSFPMMVPGEAVLLKTWDSPDPKDPSRSRFAIHSSADTSSFFDVVTPPTRESIEFRAMVLFHPKARDPAFFQSPFVPPHIARSDNNGFEVRLSTTLVDGDPNAFIPVSKLE